MPCITIPINPIGPILEIGISSPASQLTSGSAKPQAIWFKALADTGCTHTSIHASVAQKSGLKVIGKGGAQTPGGNTAVNVYHGDLFIRSLISWSSNFDWQFADRGLVEMVNPNPNFDALLGMDILNLGTFTTHGGLKVATFCW
jgi:Aspartyl protease